MAHRFVFVFFRKIGEILEIKTEKFCELIQDSEYKNSDHVAPFIMPPSWGKGRGQYAMNKTWVLVKIGLNVSCDWSLRFMKVVLLEIHLVNIGSAI